MIYSDDIQFHHHNNYIIVIIIVIITFYSAHQEQQHAQQIATQSATHSKSNYTPRGQQTAKCKPGRGCYNKFVHLHTCKIILIYYQTSYYVYRCIEREIALPFGGSISFSIRHRAAYLMMRVKRICIKQFFFAPVVQCSPRRSIKELHGGVEQLQNNRIGRITSQYANLANYTFNRVVALVYSYQKILSNPIDSLYAILLLRKLRFSGPIGLFKDFGSSSSFQFDLDHFKLKFKLKTYIGYAIRKSRIFRVAISANVTPSNDFPFSVIHSSRLLSIDIYLHSIEHGSLRFE